MGRLRSLFVFIFLISACTGGLGGNGSTFSGSAKTGTNNAAGGGSSGGTSDGGAQGSSRIGAGGSGSTTSEEDNDDNSSGDDGNSGSNATPEDDDQEEETGGEEEAPPEEEMPEEEEEEEESPCECSDKYLNEEEYKEKCEEVLCAIEKKAKSCELNTEAAATNIAKALEKCGVFKAIGSQCVKGDSGSLEESISSGSVESDASGMSAAMNDYMCQQVKSTCGDSEDEGEYSDCLNEVFADCETDSCAK